MTIPRFDQAAFWKTFRWLSSMGGALVIGWSVSGDFVKPLVAQELLKVLRQNGIDGDAIKDMGEQGIENGKNITDLNRDLDLTRGDIAALKQQATRIENQQKSLEENAKDIKGDVKELLRLMLQQRTGVNQ
jgi:hypothetical protein